MPHQNGTRGKKREENLTLRLQAKLFPRNHEALLLLISTTHDFGRCTTEQTERSGENRINIEKKFREHDCYGMWKPTYAKVYAINTAIKSWNSFIISTVCLLILYLRIGWNVCGWVLFFILSSIPWCFVRLLIIQAAYETKMSAFVWVRVCVCVCGVRAWLMGWIWIDSITSPSKPCPNCRNIIYNNSWVKTGSKQVLTRR